MLRLLAEMQGSGLQPNAVCLQSALLACARNADAQAVLEVRTYNQPTEGIFLCCHTLATPNVNAQPVFALRCGGQSLESCHDNVLYAQTVAQYISQDIEHALKE